MSNEFRELLKRVGSGTHTSKNLTRVEAAKASKMMLLQEATPAQIGAFAIAHRIKRPTPEELAGMLDTFDELGSKLSIYPPHKHKPVVFGNPYDGRSRTVPVTIITALILAAADIPVVMHGGDCMPTKYGIPLIEIWKELGVDFSNCNLAQAQEVYNQSCFGFLYLSQHFRAAQDFVPFREQIGKRPPFATAELAWCPVAGDAHLTTGFVHPPTEERFRAAFKIRGTKHFTLTKGLEGSCDLSRNRTGIIAMSKPDSDFERLLLNPIDYSLHGHDIALESKAQVISLTKEVIQGNNSKLFPAAILNGGFYLWRYGVAATLEDGFKLAEEILSTSAAKEKLGQLQNLCLAKSNL